MLKHPEGSPSWPAGLKKTQPRLRVLEALEQAAGPMTAMDLYERLQQGEEPLWLSTIYRVLDTFANQGLVQKTSVLENGIAVYELCSNQHKHYAVCVRCHRVIPMEDCPLEAIVPLVKDGFHVLGHKLEIYGYCRQCDPSTDQS